LFDRLCQSFGRDRVFMDLDGIAPGEDFARSLDEAVGACDVFLAVIGPDWVDAADEHKQPRLHSATDFVRLELRTALVRNVRVVPVLVCGARLPTEAELPEDCKGLVRRQAFELRDSRWQADTQALCEALSKAFAGTASAKGPRSPTAKRWQALAAVVVLGVGATIIGSSQSCAEKAPLAGPLAPTTSALTSPTPAKPASEPDSNPSGDPKTSTSAAGIPPLTPFELFGSWAGTAQDKGTSFRVELVVLPTCEQGKNCGTIRVSHVPCYGHISLIGSNAGDHEFNVDRFDAGSSPSCQPGGGEHFRLTGGMLAYTTSYGPRGTLKKTM
jgi:hypothetical protein